MSSWTGRTSRPRGRTGPCLAQLNDAVDAFRAEHPWVTLTIVVDASFPHRIDPSERAEPSCGVRGYVPLTAMGDPAPASAREVLRKGETSGFVVQALDAPRCRTRHPEFAAFRAYRPKRRSRPRSGRAWPEPGDAAGNTKQRRSEAA
jgi:hypothetical protein